jgi:hypothetical protein
MPTQASTTIVADGVHLQRCPLYSYKNKYKDK